MPGESVVPREAGLHGQKVLLTGASGFLGRHLAERLTRSGATLHLLSTAAAWGEAFRLRSPSTQFHPLVLGQTDLTELLNGIRPDLVIHLAAQGGNACTGCDAWASLDVNLRYGAALGVAAAASGCPRFLMAGSHFQHFENREDAPFDAYAAAKSALESMLRGISDLHGLDVVSLHLGDVLGPADPRPKVVNAILGALRDGSEMALSGGDQFLMPLHVQDAAQAFLHASLGDEGRPSCGFRRWAVRPHQAVKLHDFVSLLERESGTRLNARWGALAYRTRERMQPWEGLPLLPGWEPSHSLGELVHELWAGSAEQEG